ncbi:unnamed protein product [Ranitomeya imitator]|uniref:Fzo/mitofusin HR2 domain-containing protein n=1 Tax=Ranitomeya imitator TaxID=111125 RepID=A0ABN9L017_9NEOB|nr:unnamed protein product [Ranitomeya imitator]
MIQARKPSSSRIYYRTWKAYFRWCESNRVPPMVFSLPSLLAFLQAGLDSGLALSSLKGQVSALSILFQKTLASRPQVKTFFQGVAHAVPPYRAPVEAWDLNLVLDVLKVSPFEPLREIPLSVLSWKVAFLVAITSIRRVSELAALSCRPPFLVIHQDKVVFRPPPSFLPKVVSTFHLNEDIVLPSFCPAPTHPLERSLNKLDLVRAVRIYLDRTSSFRKTDSFFVIPDGTRRGQPASKATIARWIRMAILEAYRVKNRVPPPGIKAHTTRAVGASWAVHHRASALQLCKAATWSSIHTFAKFYKVHTYASADASLGRRILQAAVECISQSAVKTKFEQHTIRATQITDTVKAIMDAINVEAADKRVNAIENREYQVDRLEFIQSQMQILSEDVQKRIIYITDVVNKQVSEAMMDEICHLSLLVDKFDGDFHPLPQFLKHYKNELNAHIEKGMGRKLADRCSAAVNSSIYKAQEDIIENLKPLLPSAVQSEYSSCLPCKKFDLSYNLNCEKLCCDFQEDIAFRFSLGWTSLVNRYLGAKNARMLLGLAEPVFQIPRPVTTPTTSCNPANTSDALSQDELMVSVMSGLASVTSRGSMGVLIVGGVVWRAVGWKLIACSVLAYGSLYLYERLTWTTRAKERAFKQQFVNYAAQKLQLIVSITSANCSHQVQKELDNIFTRLCQQVDVTQRDLLESINKQSEEIQQLELVHSQAKVLRNKAVHLENELDHFTKMFLSQSKMCVVEKNWGTIKHDNSCVQPASGQITNSTKRRAKKKTCIYQQGSTCKVTKCY